MCVLGERREPSGVLQGNMYVFHMVCISTQRDRNYLQGEVIVVYV